MPGGDRRGPGGEGPMTGRGLGYCSGNSLPGSAADGFGRGMGMRRGAGFGGGRMNRFNAGPGIGRGRGFGGYGINPGYQGYGYYGAARSPEELADDERSFLTAQAEILQRELEAVKKRIDSLQDKMK
ncbi:MAG: DUF5320 domain-containing protein [Candidatus Krumholzibacteriota bacterium]|nr:DUF5320 domain-containing protein [Candidatus Krumholzibacteriota bacterium]